MPNAAATIPLPLSCSCSTNDRALRVMAYVAMLLLVIVFCWIVGDVGMRGARAMSWSFLAEAPSRAGRDGGIAPILYSTLLVMLVCMAVVLPMGLSAAVGLSEYLRRGGRLAGVIRVGLDVLAGTPSIAFGLFGNAFFCVFLGMRVSVLAGGLTLACMVLPLFVRLAEQSLRAVPGETRVAIDAVAMSRSTSLFRVILPSALPGITAAAGLSLSRALAETAALLFTSGYVMRTPGTLLDPGRVLSVHIFDLSMNVAGGDANAYASALVLTAALLAVSAVPLIIARGRTASRRLA